MAELSKHGKLQVATALNLLSQWKRKDGPRMDPEIIIAVAKLAEHLGVKKEYNEILIAIPLYRFVERG